MKDTKVWLVHFLGYLLLAMWGVAIYESFPFLAKIVGLPDSNDILFNGAKASFFMVAFLLGYLQLAPRFSTIIVKISESKEEDE